MKKVTFLSLVGLIAMVISSCEKDKITGIMTDQDGNEYKTINIGTQTWMAENLRTTKYRDGSSIPLITEAVEWTSLNTGAYCNYGNTNDSDTIVTYGNLYNWFAVSDSRNLAPVGWHVPNDSDWTTLINYLGGSEIAGNKLKEIGIVHWASPNSKATNETGFTALPGGFRNEYGNFMEIGYSGYWWSFTDAVDDGRDRIMFSDHPWVSDWFAPKVNGLSVRCVKD